MMFYAFIDATGKITLSGKCNPHEYDVKIPPEGQTKVIRHEEVTVFDPWYYINGEWVLQS